MNSQTKLAAQGALAIVFLGLVAAYPSSNMSAPGVGSVSMKEVVPARGIELPVRLGTLGKELVERGVIDREKFLALYEEDTGVQKTAADFLEADMNNDNLVITRENAPIVLNLFWALGLANRNPILTEGPMMEPSYGGADVFASTGGWTIAEGEAMEHYAAHPLIELSEEEQALVTEVSKNIYRPCCDNSTYFPDCNHGMAMLGLLELLASQDASKEDMYAAALAVNSYWFPDTYLTIAADMKMKGTQWSDVNPEIVLGVDYSSASGFQKVAARVRPQSFSGASCSV